MVSDSLIGGRVKPVTDIVEELLNVNFFIKQSMMHFKNYFFKLVENFFNNEFIFINFY